MAVLRDWITRIHAKGEVPRVLGAAWAIMLVAGPIVGYFLSDNLAHQYAHASAQRALLLRSVVAGALPLLLGLGVCLWYLTWPGYRIWALLILALTLLPVSSAVTSALDYWRGPVNRMARITAYRSSDWGKKWLTDINWATGMETGDYKARLSDGRELSFHCGPICLDREVQLRFTKKTVTRYESLLDRDCYLVSYETIGLIVELECASDD